MLEQKTIIIANWKMKLGKEGSEKLAKEIKKIKQPGVEVVVCPSYLYLSDISNVLKKSQVDCGAQDCFWEQEGAFTGEVSPKQIKELGGKYVIVGHSERRANFGETDEMIHKKVKAVLEVDLIPIVCIGETYQERQKSLQDYVLIHQLSTALEGVVLQPHQKMIVAYEPVWVIGTGQAISPEQAALSHQVARQTLIDLFGLAVVESQIRIVYGGSVDGNNVRKFTELKNTSGVLVGTASLNADNFLAIIKNA